MLKKILCGVFALLLTVLEHVCFGINPMDVLSTLVLAFGFTYTVTMWYDDFMKDYKCSPLMWAVYGCMLVGTAVLGAALITSKMWLMILALVIFVGAVVCYLIEKHGLKMKAVVAEKE